MFDFRELRRQDRRGRIGSCLRLRRPMRAVPVHEKTQSPARGGFVAELVGPGSLRRVIRELSSPALALPSELYICQVQHSPYLPSDSHNPIALCQHSLRSQATPTLLSHSHLSTPTPTVAPSPPTPSTNNVHPPNPPPQHPHHPPKTPPRPQTPPRPDPRHPRGAVHRPRRDQGYKRAGHVAVVVPVLS